MPDSKQHSERVAWAFERLAKGPFGPPDEYEEALAILRGVVEQLEASQKADAIVEAARELRDEWPRHVTPRWVLPVQWPFRSMKWGPKARALDDAHAALDTLESALVSALERVEQRCIGHGAVAVQNGDCPICDVEIAEAERDAAEARAQKAEAALREIAEERFGVMPDGSTPMSYALAALDEPAEER